MPRFAHCHRVATALCLMGCIAGAAFPLHAQSLPDMSGTDLTVPPELRPGVQMQAGAPPPKAKPARRHVDHRHAAAAPSADAPETTTSSRAAPQDAHPVDLGVTMRGGSGTARAYAPTGDSEVLQESGSAFGAGMKFGF